MSATPGPGRAGMRETLEVIGLRAVLLAYWGTTSVLTRRCRPRPHRGESVHQAQRMP
ncbi:MULTISPECIES: hypothetical protein [unclassified Streptomyces]|uniref:hypothetical protein n=1 Tax=unclassified Streptomyces TaxID=2593676 RepID=UPI0001C1A314|nr:MULTISPECIES: hypothetical protein [unclassified Streptomyces]PZX42632.1 hypothetical protein K373_01122 [Streptomyces sp. DvalAA-21]RAJ39337.1 hypothetical protein K351_00978 [Streptomyces sp. DpondAA-E10]RAJ53299.1 hypothetical protein K352_00375 [Streptomyces sp. DpondAA-A50]SCD60862.1 hypothetical protein GA0115235_10496 [Streptomyces sp. DpondAA-F4a]SCM11297.1 hypothetical protein SAMN04883147_107832 [Streptomyces sp. DpondAA-F4]